MNKEINTFLIVVLIAIFVIGSGAFYIVEETEQAVLTQFGKLIGEPKTEAGLYFKIPFIQTANYFEKRILEWDGDANQIPTLEKRFIWVDTTARWKIADPLKFMRTVGNEISAQSRLDDILDAKTREVLSSHLIIEAVRNSNRLIKENAADIMLDPETEFGKTALQPIEAGQQALNRKILEKSYNAVSEFGIDLLDVRIKRINYVKEVRNKVYERMISERKRAAEQYRSEGQGKRAEIEGQMTKELNDIEAEAYRKAQEIKGVADAKAIKIYANAYNKDPEFYSLLRTLDAYKMVNEDTQLIFTTDSEFYKYLNGVALQP